MSGAFRMKLFLFFITLSFNLSSSISNKKINEVLKKHDLHKMTFSKNFYFKNDDRFSSLITFEKALDLAIQSFLTSFDEGNETPLDILYDSAYEKYKKINVSHLSFDQFLKSTLKKHLNSPGSILSLIDPKSENASDFNLVKNWVFRLSITELSDHSYWCVIPRDGSDSPYIYGKN